MITQSIRYIIQLANKKPILALITILLIGMGVLAGVIKVMDKREQKEKDRLIAANLNCEKERKEEYLKYQEIIIRIQEKANQEVKDQLLEANRKLEQKLEKLENVTQASKKTLDDTRNTSKSQKKIINQLDHD